METGADRLVRYIPCRCERNNPQLDWGTTWRLASLNGLDSENQSFLWKVLHDILPTQERLHRMNLNSAPSPHCIQCTESVPVTDSVSHALLSCSQNREVSEWLISCLQQYCPALTHEQVVLLDFGTLSSNLELPLVWLVAEVLRRVWTQRQQKRKPTLYKTRADIEANISIMRKTRFKDICNILDTLIGF